MILAVQGSVQDSSDAITLLRELATPGGPLKSLMSGVTFWRSLTDKRIYYSNNNGHDPKQNGLEENHHFMGN